LSIVPVRRESRSGRNRGSAIIFLKKMTAIPNAVAGKQTILEKGCREAGYHKDQKHQESQRKEQIRIDQERKSAQKKKRNSIGKRGPNSDRTSDDGVSTEREKSVHLSRVKNDTNQREPRRSQYIKLRSERESRGKGRP